MSRQAYDPTKYYPTYKSMRKQHLSMIDGDAALALYDSLIDRVIADNGQINEAEHHLIYDVAYLESVKQKLMEDVKKRGTVETFKNGRQVILRENKSIAQVRMLMDQQRRDLNELKLTPQSRKKNADDGADAGTGGTLLDAFERF